MAVCCHQNIAVYLCTWISTLTETPVNILHILKSLHPEHSKLLTQPEHTIQPDIHPKHPKQPTT